MEFVKTIWIFTLFTILTAFICWSIAVLTFRSQSLINMFKVQDKRAEHNLKDMPWYKVYSEEYKEPEKE